MQTIIFDVDDTLYDQLQPFRHAVQQIIPESFQQHEIIDLYKKSREYSDAVFEQHIRGEITALDLQIYRIQKACDDFSISLTREQATAFQQCYLREQQNIKLFPEMECLLDQLYQSEISLAVLTNGEYHHQMMKVAQLNVTKWIPESHLFISGQIGYSKPNVQAFQYVEDKMNLVKGQTLYIGDSFPNDVAGAKQAGWQAAWLNHRQRPVLEPSIVPDYTFCHVQDVLAIAKDIGIKI
ncbi:MULTISPECIES: HAD family hydrolase [Gracilibacillus]|uniref:HAD family hydrolase n=1 Tax=Gracilibacillus TaxID=74385 RepID=UPI000825BFF6|nr:MULTISPECIES: HAD family hydrolase [Gracilibacillus]